MSRIDDINHLPDDLPVPQDDGACDHVSGMSLPRDLDLEATNGTAVNLAAIPGYTVVYIYPRTGLPDQNPPSGWNEIPGARGCTPQSCGFRDHYALYQELGASVYGLSTQDSAYQREAKQRLGLPFELLSDAQLSFATALNLPTFSVNHMPLIKRISLVILDGTIEKVFYPVFPPNQNASEVLRWLRSRVA